jgi:uncharacterized protein (DUF1015 family)
MATLNPFRGLCYDASLVGDLAAVVAPPYDVIDPVLRERLYARGEYNAVRLILSMAPSPYEDAARTLARWRASGALRLDAEPALYVYAQRFCMADGRTRERVGVIGALRLEASGGGRIHRHEKTRERAKSDRLRLLEACRTSLSPIFGLVSTPGWTFGSLVPARPADIDVRDDAGGMHRVWRLTDPALLATVMHRLAERDVFIADGHHRYETALAYASARRQALGSSAPPFGTEPYDSTLAYLTTMEDPGLVVLPTHRVLRSLATSAGELRVALARWFRIEDLPWTAAGSAELERRLASPRPPGPDEAVVRIGAAVHGTDSLWLLGAPVSSLPLPPDVPPALRALDVTALHKVVFEHVLGLTLDARGASDEIEYTQEAARALAPVAAGRAGAAFLLPSADLAAVRDVSLAGLTMPAKSTYFYPKLLTGLVFYTLDDPAPAGAAASAG